MHKTGEVAGSISPLQGMQTLSRNTKNTDSKPLAFCLSQPLPLVHTYLFAIWLSRTCTILFPGCLSLCTDIGSCWLSVSACCSLPPVFAFCPIEKECDLNKHLKVRDPERKKLCSRELICNVCYLMLVIIGRVVPDKIDEVVISFILLRFFSPPTQIDSTHQQQSGMEKTKNSDQLPVESNVDLEGQNMEQHSEAFKDKTTTQDSKPNLKNNCHSLRYVMGTLFAHFYFYLNPF